MILQYSNQIYPLDFYVGTTEDIKKAERMFYFYDSIVSLNEDKAIEDAKINMKSASGATFIIKDKKDKTKGILILLDMNLLKEGDYTFILDVISHESSHAVDATYQLIHQEPETFDDGNEPHAYLTGWFAGCVGDYLTRYFKNNGRKEI